jgi:dinuclear metal center YbgI/SA1388 family protein
LEEIAPPGYRESFDNVGLLIGDRNAVLKKGLICLDVTQAVMEEALAKEVNFIVSHHPLIFNPLKKITGVSLCEKMIVQAIKNDIAVYAMHTNLDNISQGVNRRFADKLGLNNCKILKPVQGNLCKLVTFVPEKQADAVRNALFAAGGGKIGNYDACSCNSTGYGTFRANEQANPFVGEKNQIHQEKEIRIEIIFPDFLNAEIITALLKSHPYEEPAYDIISLANNNPMVGSGMIGELDTAVEEAEFLHFVKDSMQIACLKHSKFRNKKIKKVALCGGSGAFLTGDAIGQHADIFISSEFKHNHFVDHAQDLLLVDIGHYESEIQTKQLLYDILIEKFSNFATSENEQNPILYF